MSQIRNQVRGLILASLLTFVALFWIFSLTWAGTPAGLLFGGVIASMTLILGLVTICIQHMRQQSMLARKQKRTDTLSSHQERTIEIDLDFENAFDLALKALQTLDNQDIPITMTGIRSKQSLRIRKSDKSMGRIEAELRAKTLGIQDFFSFSRIVIQIQRIDAEAMRIRIESEPTYSFERFELGRHIHYVTALAIYMRQATAENNLGRQFDRQSYGADNDRIQSLLMSE